MFRYVYVSVLVYTYTVFYVCMCVQLYAGSQWDVEVSLVVGFVKCSQAAIFLAFTSCHSHCGFAA